MCSYLATQILPIKFQLFFELVDGVADGLDKFVVVHRFLWHHFLHPDRVIPLCRYSSMQDVYFVHIDGYLKAQLAALIDWFVFRLFLSSLVRIGDRWHAQR